MTSSIPDSSLAKVSDLLAYYSFEVENQSQANLLDDWLETYPTEWVRLALIEALFRGRYKTISVDGLLADWERRGQPYYHFNREFEALICRNFPKFWLNLDATPQSEYVSVNYISTETTDPNVQDNSDDLLAWPPTADTSNLPLPWSPLATDQLWNQEPNSSTYNISSFQEELQTSNHAPEQCHRSSITLAIPARRLAVLPIHQFTPEQKSSEHYRKLVAMISQKSPISIEKGHSPTSAAGPKDDQPG